MLLGGAVAVPDLNHAAVLPKRRQMGVQALSAPAPQLPILQEPTLLNAPVAVPDLHSAPVVMKLRQGHIEAFPGQADDLPSADRPQLLIRTVASPELDPAAIAALVGGMNVKTQSAAAYDRARPWPVARIA